MKSFARIHRQNLINAGILPLEFVNEADYDTVEQSDVLELADVRAAIENGGEIVVKNVTKGTQFSVKCELSSRMKDIMLCGGLLDYTKKLIANN